MVTSGSGDAGTSRDLLRSLAPAGAPGAILAAARMDGVSIRALSARIDPGPLLWALERAACVRHSVEEEYLDVPDLPSRQIQATAEAWFISIIALLADQEGDDAFVRAMSELGRAAADDGVSVKRITRGIRRVQGECLLRFLDAQADRELSTAEYARVVAMVSQVTDDGVAQFMLDYLDERSKLVDSEAMRRRELVGELLAGGQRVSRTRAAEVAAVFGFDIGHVHTAFVIEHQPHSASTERASIARDVPARLRDATLLLHPESHTRTVFWVTACKAPGAAVMGPVLSALRAFTGAVRAMGEPAPGLQGFRRSYAQASDLATIAPRLPRTGEVMCWADHALTVTLGFDAGRSGRFVRSVLGPLAEPTEKAAEQRETLRAYLSSDKSLVHAAEERNVHRNTIVYRLQRIEQLIGRPLRGNVLDLQCALQLVDQFGNEMLRPRSTDGPVS